MRLPPAQPSRIAPHGRTALANYSGDAGAGSHIITNISESPGWRAALLGTVAAGSLWLYSARSARAGPDACDLSGISPTQTALCQGDQSDGIASGVDFNAADVETLIVNNLLFDITPRPDISAIYFVRSGAGNDIVIDVDTTDGPNGTKTIFAYNALGTGIWALNDAAITIDFKGNIQATAASGIVAGVSASGTSIEITTAGGSVIGSYGIVARNFGTGALTIDAHGDVEGTVGSGIYALSATGIVDITTEGDVTAGLDGIYARSGSGFSGDDITITGTNDIHAGRVGILGISYGGGVTVHHTGNIVAETSHGINAVSFDFLGLGPIEVVTEGTIQAYRSGIAVVGVGNVTIEHTGDITSQTAVGIGAVSASGGIDVTLRSGTVSAPVFGVQFFGAGSHTLVNYGTITSPATAVYSNGHLVVGNFGNILGLTDLAFDAVLALNEVNNLGTMAADGLVIRGFSGTDIVLNDGTITGDVDLGTGNNTFDNLESGVFNSGDYVILGANRLLSNAGLLSPGGTGSVRTTALTGDLTQAPTGAFAVDINGGLADKIEVSGNASVAGLVTPNLLNLDGTTQWTIMTSGAGSIDNGVTVNDTLIVDYELLFPSATQMDLVIAGVDFALSGLNQNETAIANNLNDIFAAGNFPKLESLLTALANLQSVGDLANVLDQLSPEIYLDTEIATLFSAQNFASSLMTCPVRDGPAAFIKEGECVWARISGRDLDQSATAQSFGFDERSFEVAGGMQGALGEVWRVGFAGAYEHSKLDTTSNASSDADRIHGGAVLKYNPGALLLAGAVSGGWGWYETERQISFPGFLALAQSDQDIGYLNGRLRAAYQFGAGTWYLKPMVDLDATHVSLDGVSETGAGGVGLKVHGANETVLSATPALELGAQFGAAYGTLVRPYVRGGATFYDDPDFVLLASFEGAPSGVGPFRIATSTDDTIGTVGAGVDVIGAEGASFRLYYEGRFGDLVEQHAGGIKGTLPF